MKLIWLVPALLPLALSTGCATVLRGASQDVRVETDPPGASADGQTITTPGVLKISRKAKLPAVLVEKEGYVPAHVPLERRFDVPYAGDLVLALLAGVGGAVTESVVGLIALPAAAVSVDVVTGANYRIEPSELFLLLEPVSNAEPNDQ